jgi:glycopeptide antibiotics resistance protein
MKEAIRNIVIPVFIGIILFGVEILIFLKFHSIKTVFVYSIVYIIAAYCIVKLYRRYDVCGWFQIGSCGSLLCITFILFLLPKTPLRYIAIYVLLMNWLAITSVCIILKFLVREDRYSDFKRFFRLSSIIFGLVYVIILFYALFFKTVNIRAGMNGVNLVPFSTIMPYIKKAITNLNGPAIMNILANIFLFIPLGFYVEVMLKKRKMIIKIMIILLIPIIVELIQFVWSLGICDVDDVILNAIGGLLGILVFKVVEKLYCIVKKDDSARLFLI